MKTLFLAKATFELYETIDFYDYPSPGLGSAFLQEFKETMEFIKLFPEGWQKTGLNTRKCLLKKFPYMILYIAEKNRIIITSIAHQHRHPRAYLS
ncbi:MAG: type II toxin-antitoxin system RelE/ParE family toxin [Candidatus Omnitrophica bacterium]|nr:type II toxin-antitoxin system RelE/ParE family toxin [Candidatus Omnitrophota bacterium]